MYVATDSVISHVITLLCSIYTDPLTTLASAATQQTQVTNGIKTLRSVSTYTYSNTPCSTHMCSKQTLLKTHVLKQTLLKTHVLKQICSKHTLPKTLVFKQSCYFVANLHLLIAFVPCFICSP